MSQGNLECVQKAAECGKRDPETSADVEKFLVTMKTLRTNSCRGIGKVVR